MNKRYRDDPEVSMEEREISSRGDRRTYKYVRYTKGVTQFSSQESELSLYNEMSRGIGLDWQSYSELNFGRGLLTIFRVLDEVGFSKNNKISSKLLSEIKEEIGEQRWRDFKRRYDRLVVQTGEAGCGEIFAFALWAQLFAEPFGEVWLAAMAQHALFVEENYFAAGYLIALLDQKRENETHFMRGKKGIDAAREGGLARGRAQKAETEKILQQIEKYRVAGHSVRNAARLAFEKDLGTSPGANEKLWYRHKNK